MARKKRIYGEGTITPRKDGRYQVAVPDLHAKSGRRYAYAPNEREAARIRRQLLSEVEQGKLPASKQLFQQHVREWLDMKRKSKDYKPNSYINVLSRMEAHFIPVLGHLPLNKLSPSHIQKLVNKFLDDGLKPNTIRGYMAKLKVCLDSAVKQGKIESNPCDRVELPKKQRSKKAVNNYLTAEEVTQLLDACQDHKLFSTLIPLALATECREGELLALTWDDINFEQGTISINKNLSREMQEQGEKRTHALLVVTPKSESSVRVLPLPDYAVAALRTHKTNQIKEMLAVGKRNPLNLLYPNNGGYYWGASVSRAFTNFARKAGVNITFHGLRHTGATLLLEAGVDPNVVKERLGHSDIAITLGVYGHVTKRMRDQSVKVLENLFTDKKNGKNEAI